MRGQAPQIFFLEPPLPTMYTVGACIAAVGTAWLLHSSVLLCSQFGQSERSSFPVALLQPPGTLSPPPRVTASSETTTTDQRRSSVDSAHLQAKFTRRPASHDAAAMDATVQPEPEEVMESAAAAGVNCDQFTFVLYVFVLGAICLFGLVGNTLSFLVLRSDRRVHVATFLLQVGQQTYSARPASLTGLL